MNVIERKETVMRTRRAYGARGSLLLLPGCGSTVSRVQSDGTSLDPALGLTMLAVQRQAPLSLGRESAF